MPGRSGLLCADCVNCLRCRAPTSRFVGKSWMAGSSPAMTTVTITSRLCDAALARRIASGTRFTSLQRGALGRRGRPRLDQRVVVDGFALRLLVRKFALGRDVAVLGGLREPVLGALLLVELRSAGALHAGLLEPLHHRVLCRSKRVHRGLR